MSPSLIAALTWLVLANVIGMFPSRKNHWPAAYILIAIGVPLLGWVTLQNGPIIGLIALIAGSSILRWPLVYLWRWLKPAKETLPE
ncbi:MAG: DUF2484 family protein [Paracoccaceae bacterium]